MKPVLSVFVIGLFMLCAAYAKADPVTIATGKTIDTISVGPGESDHILAIKYRTALPLADVTALHEEADAVWDHFALSDKESKYDQVILSATAADGSIDFALQKTNGNWHAVDFKSGEDARLDADLARKVMRRGDTAMDHDEMNAALLYLGDSWTGTSHYKAQGGYSSVSTANRTQLAEFTSHMAKNYKHSRNIYNVTIAQDGKTAKVESYETESGTLKDKSFSTVEHSLDNLAIENGSIVVVKSLSDVTIQSVAGASGGNAHAVMPHFDLGSRAEFLRAIVLRVFTIGAVCMAGILVWLIAIKMQRERLKALVNSGTSVKGTITFAEVYNANARRGTVTGLDIAYQFPAEAGTAQHGRMRVFASGSSDPASYATGASANVVYLAQKPAISALADLMAAKNAALASAERRLTILAPIAFILTLASAVYLFR